MFSEILGGQFLESPDEPHGPLVGDEAWRGQGRSDTFRVAEMMNPPVDFEPEVILYSRRRQEDGPKIFWSVMAQYDSDDENWTLIGRDRSARLPEDLVKLQIAQFEQGIKGVGEHEVVFGWVVPPPKEK